MSYTLAALLGLLAAVGIDLAVLRTRLLTGRVFWLTYPIVLAFQLLANGILTGWQIVRYDPAAIIGVRIAHAPIEDLAFGFALVLSTLSLWSRLNAGQRHRPRPGAGGQRSPAAPRAARRGSRQAVSSAPRGPGQEAGPER